MRTIILIDNQLVTASVVQIWFRNKGVYLVTNRTEIVNKRYLEVLCKEEITTRHLHLYPIQTLALCTGISIVSVDSILLYHQLKCPTLPK